MNDPAVILLEVVLPLVVTSSSVSVSLVVSVAISQNPELTLNFKIALSGGVPVQVSTSAKALILKDPIPNRYPAWLWSPQLYAVSQLVILVLSATQYPCWWWSPQL